jgi:hypothetical protein
MKLTSFRIVNCFGFRDSGVVNLNDTNNFIYILGRNSSGKSSLLNAIKYFEWGIIPANQPNFQNFHDSGKSSFLIGSFSIAEGDLTDDRFARSVRAALKQLSIDEGALKHYQPLNSMLDSALDIYSEFIKLICLMN